MKKKNKVLGVNRYGYTVVEKEGSASFQDIGCEVYNPHDEAVVFELSVKDFLTQLSVPKHELVKVCKPDDFCYLPYGVKHYTSRWDRAGSSAEGITVHLNFGDNVGIGCKPDADTRRAMRRGQRRIF